MEHDLRHSFVQVEKNMHINIVFFFLMWYMTQETPTNITIKIYKYIYIYIYGDIRPVITWDASIVVVIIIVFDKM